jgi:hypothetical protein
MPNETTTRRPTSTTRASDTSGGATHSDAGTVEDIIVIGKAIIDALGPLFRSFAELTGGVTNIKQIRNQTDKRIRIWKIDGGRSETMEAAPRSNRDGDFWIPWAENARDYAEHHMTISADGQPIAYLWQQNKNLTFGVEDRIDGETGHVAGLVRGGGDRTLVVEEREGRIGFAFGPHPMPER